MFAAPRAALLAAALALTLVQTAGPAHAVDVSWSPVHDLQDTTRIGAYPELASSSDGMKVAAVWAGGGANGTDHLYVATSGDGGRTWGESQIVASDPEGSAQPEIISSGDGSRVTVLWTANQSQSEQIIMSRTSTDGGRNWGDAVEVSSQGEASYDPRLVGWSDGVHLVATWSQTGGGVIHSSYSGNGGATWSRPESVANALPPVSVDLVASGDGTRLMQFVGGTGGLDVVVSEDGGQSWNPKTRIASGIPVFQGDAVISADGQTAAVVWREFNTGRLRTFRSVSPDGGVTWSAPVGVSAPNADVDKEVLTMSSDGSVITIVWVVPQGATAGVHAMTSSDAGVQWGPVRDLFTGDGVPRMVRVVGGTDGAHLTVTWSAWTDTRYRIEASSSADTGVTWGPPTTLVEGLDSENSDLSSSTDGTRVAASWWAARDNYSREMAQVAGGTMGLPEFTVQPSALDFGTVRTGKSASRAVTVTNTGTADLSVGSVSASGPGFTLDRNDCAVVAAGASCTVNVRFAPARAGAATGSLNFATNTGAHAVALNGTGEAAPTGRKAQKPRDAKGLPPKRLKVSGVTVLTGRNARTTAGQLIRTRVAGGPTAAGEVRYYRVIRGPQGKVSIRTYGYRGLRVVVVQYARGTEEFRAYRKRTIYVGGAKR